MKRIALLLGLVAFAGCGKMDHKVGKSGPINGPVNLERPEITGTVKEGETLTGSKGKWTDNVTAYEYQWERCATAGASLCTNIGGATAQTRVLAAADVGFFMRFSVKVKETSGTSASSSATSVVVLGTEHTSEVNCFEHEATCGYPSPSTTGVEGGVTLTGVGATTISTPNTTFKEKEVTGTAGANGAPLVINANNTTIENVKVSATGSCGVTNACGNSDIKIEPGITGTVIKHVEITKTGTEGLSEGIRNSSGTGSLVGSFIYSHGVDATIFGAGEFHDNYMLATLGFSADHLENFIFTGQGGSLIVKHNTLLNPVSQTTNVASFAEGANIPEVRIENNLMAGGKFLFYINKAGLSSIVEKSFVLNNRYARCAEHGGGEAGGKEIKQPNGTWFCKGLAEGASDGHGYYPKGGSAGTDGNNEANTVISGNFWDDNKEEAK